MGRITTPLFSVYERWSPTLDMWRRGELLIWVCPGSDILTDKRNSRRVAVMAAGRERKAIASNVVLGFGTSISGREAAIFLSMQRRVYSENLTVLLLDSFVSYVCAGA